MTEKIVTKGYEPKVVQMEYPSNSHKKKQEEKSKPKKEIKKIEHVNARKKERSVAAKVVGRFITSDIHDIKSYVINDVIIPNIRDLILQIIQDGSEMLLKGEVRSKKKTSGVFTNYGGFFAGGSKKPDRKIKARGDFEPLYFDTIWEPEEILEGMMAAIEQYGVVTVSDMYEMAGVDSNFVDTQYGWDNVSEARVKRDDGGYILDLPKPFRLED